MGAKYVCDTADVPRGEVAGFVVADAAGAQLQIAIVHTESEGWYALADRCSHGRVALSDGFVEDECIECPRHGALFALSSGEPVSPPASQAVKTYPVRIADGRVLVEL